MELNASSLKINEEHSQEMIPEDPTCGGCGKSYRRPLLATISGAGRVQTYQACPFCMTKVGDAKPQKTEKPKATTVSETVSKHQAAKPDGKCLQYFGYLNKRTKGTPIPESCLTCEKMVECMYG